MWQALCVCASSQLVLSLPRLRICGCAWFADAAPLLLNNCSGRGLFQGCAAKKGRVASLFAVLGLSAFVGARGCGGGVSPRTTEKKILSRPSSVRLRRSLDKISFLRWQRHSVPFAARGASAAASPRPSPLSGERRRLRRLYRSAPPRAKECYFRKYQSEHHKK